MILCINPNPAIDVTYTLPALHPGESHRVAAPRRQAGGKAVNVARVLHARGVATTVIAPIGGDTGTAFRAGLDEAGIPHALVPVQAPTRSTIAIVADDATTNLNEVGGPLTDAEWSDLLHAVDAALATGAVDVLVVSGSLPLGTPEDFIATLVQRAVRANVPAIADVSGPQLLAAVDAGAAVVKPNRDELAATTGDDDPVRAARSVAGRGNCLVLASLGADGMIAIEHSGTALHGVLDGALRGNPTGAGDAAVAAVAHALATGERDRRHIVRDAVAWSAAAVLSPVAGVIADPGPLAARVTVRDLAELELP